MNVFMLLENFSAVLFLLTLALLILVLAEMGKIADMVGLSGSGLPRVLRYLLISAVMLLTFSVLWYSLMVLGLRLTSLPLLFLIASIVMLLLSLRELKKAIQLLLYVG